MPKADRLASPSSVASAIARYIPGAKVLQVKPTRVWICEGDEPFCEVDFHRQGALVAARMSAHCGPAWAAITATALCTIAPEVIISPHVFLQDASGRILYGQEAEAHWALQLRVQPLLNVSKYSG